MQLAKLAGRRGSGGGGSEKTAYAREALGADVAQDHRAADFVRRLADAAPDGVDAYCDNVGGKVLLTVLVLMKDHGRIAVCGLAAWYNLDGPETGVDHAPGFMRTILRMRPSV